MDDMILEMENIGMVFPGVRALDNVTFGVRRGEIHALVGENGAGKSTLMKILSGVYPAGSYEGEVRIDGNTCHFTGIREAEKAGVAIIHQELAQVKMLSVMENILLGNEIARLGVIDWDQSLARVESALSRVELDVPPDREIKHLGVGEQQLVEIAKAFTKNARILILDEPTAALSDTEAQRLLAILTGLKDEGVTCIYISHRLEEVLAIADRTTVLRDGKTVGTYERQELTKDSLIARMVGREMTDLYPRRQPAIGEPCLTLEDWEVVDEGSGRSLHDMVFTLHQGEVLGLAGLVGAGRSELVMSLFNCWGKKLRGKVVLLGRSLEITSPQDAISAGICLASEDRKRYGLIISSDVRTNTTLSALDKVSHHGLIDFDEEIGQAEKYVRELTIKTPSIEQIVGNLSGGNQQKVVLAKCLMTGPSAVILDEPTRGVDVGAKYEIYTIINELAAKGVGVLVISSDLPELLGICDRILVMHEGRFTGDVPIQEATQENIMACAVGMNL